ncbi:MAG: hypothetical protein ACUVV4_03155 [Candidatus Bathyarchaeia archaeon]
MTEAMLHRIRQVKREIRTLGVAAGQRRTGEGFEIVGVVYRGNFLLDGVMRNVASGPDLTLDIAEMVLSSSHHEQIRVLILKHPLAGGVASLNALRLSSSVSKPVLILSFSPIPPYAGEGISFQLINIRGTGLNVASIGLKRRETEMIIKMASQPDEGVPECVRVADLILDSLAECD